MTNKELLDNAIGIMKASEQYKYEHPMSDDYMWLLILDEHHKDGDYNFKVVQRLGEALDEIKISIVVSVPIIGYGEVLIRIDGQYDSWGGDHFPNPPYLVEPVEVTRTEYRRKK